MNSFLKLSLALQRAQIKIFNFGLQRKIFEISTKKDNFKIINSSKNSFFILIFFGSCSLGLISSIEEIYKGEYIFAGINIIIGIIGFRKLLWLLYGKEILTIEKTNLIIEKEGTL